jgi:methylglutaconyl-CoA hydratase
MNWLITWPPPLADPAARCIVITGAGPAFCAGADLKNPPGSATEGRKAVGLPDILQPMMNGDKPVIAAVNGAAFAGGLGLVGAADIVITVDDAPFSFSEVRIGVIPAIIAVVCLPKLGRHHGMKLILTGERFSGTQAVAMGFAHRAVPADQLAGRGAGRGRHAAAGRPERAGRVQEAGAPIPTLSEAEAFTVAGNGAGACS